MCEILEDLKKDKDEIERLLTEYKEINKKNEVMLQECNKNIKDFKRVIIILVIMLLFICCYMITNFSYKVNSVQTQSNNKKNKYVLFKRMKGVLLWI